MNYIEDLLAEALITAPGCPETVVERMMRTSCISFYRETDAWQLTTDPMPVAEGVRGVELDIPQFTQPCRVYWARLAGDDLAAMSPRNLTERRGTPEGYAFIGLDAGFQLDKLPDRSYGDDGLIVRLSVAPTVQLDDIPDALYYSHRDGILYGTQARLLAMPNVPWGNLNGAMAMAAMYEAEKLKAKREARQAQAPVTRVVRYGGI